MNWQLSSITYQVIQPLCICDIEHAADQFWHDVNVRYENCRVDPLRPLLEPVKLYQSVNELFGEFGKYARIRLSQAKLGTKAGHTNLAVKSCQMFVLI